MIQNAKQTVHSYVKKKNYIICTSNTQNWSNYWNSSKGGNPIEIRSNGVLELQLQSAQAHISLTKTSKIVKRSKSLKGTCFTKY